MLSSSSSSSIVTVKFNGTGTARRIPGKAFLNRVARKSAKLAVRLRSITVQQRRRRMAAGRPAGTGAFVLRRETAVHGASKGREREREREGEVAKLNLTRFHTSPVRCFTFVRRRAVPRFSLLLCSAGAVRSCKYRQLLAVRAKRERGGADSSSIVCVS